MERLIDYDEFKWQLTHWYDDKGWAHQVDKMVFDLMELDEAMEKTPIIDPVKHGHWIERTKVHPDLPNDSTYNYECSNCGYWDTHGANVEVPYCWHCGCKMDEVTE